MPITQTRMLRVIEAGTTMLRVCETLHRIMRDNAHTIAQANTVADHTPDTNARATITELVNMLGAMATTIHEEMVNNFASIASIRTEAEHFARVQRKNERQAMYARQKRYVDRSITENGPETSPLATGRVTPEFASLDHIFNARSGVIGSEASALSGDVKQTPEQDLTQTPEFLAFQAAMREKYAREKHLYPGVQDADADADADPDPGANAVAHTRPRTDTSGTTRWLPPDDELNARPNNSDKDLL